MLRLDDKEIKASGLRFCASEMRYACANQILVCNAGHIPIKYLKRQWNPSKQLAAA